jgi:hypothetical protein
VLRFGMGNVGLLVAATLMLLMSSLGCGRSRHSGPAWTDQDVPEELVSFPHAASCPANLAVDDRDIFWIGTGGDGELGVWSAPKAGGGALRLAVLRAPAAKGPPYVIAVGEDAAYFAGADADGLRQVLVVDKSGGEPKVVAPFGAVGLLADPSVLFIAAAGAEPPGIYAVTAEDAEPFHVAGTEAGVNRELAMTATHLYWTSGSNLLRVPRTGGSSSIVHDSVAAYPGVLAVDSGDIYWADRDGWLKRAPVEGGTPTLLAEFSAESLEARRGAAFGIGSLRGVKGILRASPAEGAEFVRGAFASGALALDDAFAYFARCEFDCLIDGDPADCADYEYNVTLVRVPQR